MDILDRCKLITDNILVHSRGYGRNDEIELEMYKEMKAEIISKLEEIVTPIIEGYKKVMKNNFYEDYRVEIKYEVPDLDEIIRQNRIIISRYVSTIEAIDSKIDELTPKLEPHLIIGGI